MYLSSENTNLHEAKRELLYWKDYKRRVGGGYVQDYYIDKYEEIIDELEKKRTTRKKRVFPDKPVIDYVGWMESERKKVKRLKKKVRENKATMLEIIIYRMHTDQELF